MLVTNGFARFARGLFLSALRADLGWACAQACQLVGAVATMVLVRRIGASTLFAQGLVATALGPRHPRRLTMVFAVARTAGPRAAGLPGDPTVRIGARRLSATAVLLAGAAAAPTQRRP